MNELRKIPAGELGGLISKFIMHKRALGYKYIVEEDQLYRFSIFSLSYKIENRAIPKELIDDWINKNPNESRCNQGIRINITRLFLKFAADNGYGVTLPAKGKGFRSLYVPYIFNTDEMARIFHACDTLTPYPGTDKHVIIPLIFRLMYGCGLRESEVASIKCRDVDLSLGIITIRNAKFNKDRLVPMSSSLTQIMNRYHALQNHSCHQDDYFFRSKYLHQIGRHWIYRRFRDVLRSCGISHGGKGKGPRAHDLRHSFCVHSLKMMTSKGMDIYCALPFLATYVGHASISATQSYVRLTADVYPELVEQISKTCAYILPKEERHENN